MNLQQNQHDEYYKIIIVGNSGAGKTNMVQTFSKGVRPHHTAPTIGIDYCSKIIRMDNNRKLKMQIWDTAGNQLYRSVAYIHYRNASGAFAVFDVTSRTTFNDIPRWISDIRQHANENTFIFIIGNKIDLVDYRVISREEGENMASREHARYMETTIEDPQTLQNAFEQLALQITKSNKTKNLQLSRSGIQLNNTNQITTQNSGCPC